MTCLFHKWIASRNLRSLVADAMREEGAVKKESYQ